MISEHPPKTTFLVQNLKETFLCFPFEAGKQLAMRFDHRPMSARAEAHTDGRSRASSSLEKKVGRDDFDARRSIADFCAMQRAGKEPKGCNISRDVFFFLSLSRGALKRDERERDEGERAPIDELFAKRGNRARVLVE